MSEIGPVRVDRIHEDGLRGNGIRIMSDGNGNGRREVRLKGGRGEINVSGKNGEAVEEIIKFLQEEFGINGELAGEFAREMCEEEK